MSRDASAATSKRHATQLQPRRVARALALAIAVAVPTRGMTAPIQDPPNGNVGEKPAMTWSTDELRRIVAADDLHVSPFREDGATYGTPTWIWCVAVDGSLYVRAYNGRNSRWYQAAIRQQAGRITAAGMTREVRFEPVEGPVNDRIDEAYRAKYQGSRYLAPMVGDGPRSATVRIVPRDSGF